MISVKNLSKIYQVKKKQNVLRDMFMPSYSEVHAVNNINFEIEKGESVAFLGPNGAGKTTTMKMLSGLIYPTSGEIDVMGFYPFDRDRKFLSQIALVMGNKSGLEWDLTAKQSFELNKKIYNISERKFKNKVSELTELLDTKHVLDTQVRKLSLGERLKMEIIGAILHEPKMLFLDEPTIGLDVISKQKIREFFREIQREYEITLLLTSHDMMDVEKVCDRVIVINKGRIGHDNKLKNLVDEYSKEKYVKFIFKKTPKRQVFEKYGNISEMGEGYYIIKTDSKKMPELMDKVTSKHSLLDIDIMSTPLDEIVSEVFRRG